MTIDSSSMLAVERAEHSGAWLPWQSLAFSSWGLIQQRTCGTWRFLGIHSTTYRFATDLSSTFLWKLARSIIFSAFSPFTGPPIRKQLYGKYSAYCSRE